MVAQRRADGRPHADVHAAVAGDHDEGDVLADVDLAPALPLVEHLHQAATAWPRRSGTGCGCSVTRWADVRIARGDDHRAARLEQHDDVAFEAREELVQRREDAAARAGAVAGRDALRPAPSSAGAAARLTFSLPVSSSFVTLTRPVACSSRVIGRSTGGGVLLRCPA